MKTKLRTTYLVTVLFFLFVTVGSMILFYNMFSEEFIIANNKKIMNSVFEDAQGMDLSSLTKSDRKRLKEFSDKGGVIAIYDGEKIIYFSGDTPERKKNIKRRKFDEKIYALFLKLISFFCLHWYFSQTLLYFYIDSCFLLCYTVWHPYSHNF